MPIHFCEEVAQLKLGSQAGCEFTHFFYPFLRRSGPIETLLMPLLLLPKWISIHFCEEVAQLKHYFSYGNIRCLRKPIHFCEEVAQLKLD